MPPQRKNFPINSAQAIQPPNHSTEEGGGLPFLALMGFICGIIFNPARVFPPLQALHLQDIFAITAFVGLIVRVFSGKHKISFGKIELFYILFAIATGFGLLQLRGTYTWEQGVIFYGVTLRTMIILLLIRGHITSWRLFRKGFLIFMGIVALFELHSLKAIVSGQAFYAGRFDSWVGQISNSDNIGAFMVMMLPLFLELFLYSRTFLRKIFILGFVIIDIMIVVLTQTRSAFLSLLVVIPLWLLYKQHRQLRIVMMGIMLCCMVFVGVYMANSAGEYGGYFDRIKTIFSPESQAEDSNVQSRLLLWKQGLEIWAKFPVLGCGRGGLDLHETLTSLSEDGIFSGETSITQLSLHQSFIQSMAERGTLGTFFYCLFIYFIWNNIKKSGCWLRKQGEKYAFYASVFRGLRLSLLAFLINAQFMTITEDWILIILAGFSSSLSGLCLMNEINKERGVNEASNCFS